MADEKMTHTKMASNDENKSNIKMTHTVQKLEFTTRSNSEQLLESLVLEQSEDKFLLSCQQFPVNTKRKRELARAGHT